MSVPDLVLCGQLSSSHFLVMELIYSGLLMSVLGSSIHTSILIRYHLMVWVNQWKKLKIKLQEKIRCFVRCDKKSIMHTL